MTLNVQLLVLPEVSSAVRLRVVDGDVEGAGGDAVGGDCDRRRAGIEE